MRPIATCPVCGNHEDGTIQFTATVTATIEKGNSFLYENANVAPDARTKCMKCGHVGTFPGFRGAPTDS